MVRVLAVGGGASFSIAFLIQLAGCFGPDDDGSAGSVVEAVVLADCGADLASDPANCGTCGAACAEMETCLNGLCAPVEAEPWARAGAIGPAAIPLGTWTERGPTVGGRMDAFVVDKTCCAQNRLITGLGGIWRKLEGDASWTLTASSGLAENTVVHLEWDVVTAGRLYASTSFAGTGCRGRHRTTASASCRPG